MSMVDPEHEAATSADQSWAQLRTGDWVNVRTAEQIVETLDESGSTDGLSFMPEMAAYCGKSFRIGRSGTTVCINSESNYMGRVDDCFVLQSQTIFRCDGAFHGGCQMACQFLWKSSWLERRAAPRDQKDAPDPSNAAGASSNEANSALANRLAKLVKVEPNIYRCQATQLVQIATPTPVHNFRQYADEHRRSGIKLVSIFRFALGVALKKVLRRPHFVTGNCDRKTPRSDKELKVGDLVRVKSIDEIKETLDKQGCNRGLWFDPDEMAPLCGKELHVSRVIEKLIDERNGKLRKFPSHTVVLSEIACSGVFKRFCSRGLFHFWRTIWLEKVESVND